MLFLSIVHYYFFWHYSRAFFEIFNIWKNFIWFVGHFFSLRQLTASWFSPWKRTVQGRGEKWNFEDLAGYIIINIVSRIVGAVIRTVIIFLGIVSVLMTIVGGVIVYVFWIFAPVVLIFLLGFGLTLLIA
jgi:hypothetical protein